jgi:hypothetical protein
MTIIPPYWDDYYTSLLRCTHALPTSRAWYGEHRYGERWPRRAGDIQRGENTQPAQRAYHEVGSVALSCFDPS